MLRVGRNREKHKRMPVGWAPSASGTIYFRPTNEGDRAIVRGLTGGKLSLRLGATHDEAAETFARLIVAARRRQDEARPGTVAEIVQRARAEWLPRMPNPETRAWRERHLDALGKTFGSRRYAATVHDAARDPALLRAIDGQRYLDANARRPVAANREVKSWRIVFDEARRRWGLTEYNPFAGLALHQEAPRDVLPTPAGVRAAYRRLDPAMRFAVVLAAGYGRRRGEILGLTLSSAEDDGLHLRRGKRAREIVLRWDRPLRRAWERLMAWRSRVERGGKVASLAAILNQRGKPVTVTGFNSAWRRARAGFHFHDLRAYRASSLPRGLASVVLGHDDQVTTESIYRRGPLVVEIPENRRELPKFPKADKA